MIAEAVILLAQPLNAPTLRIARIRQLSTNPSCITCSYPRSLPGACRGLIALAVPFRFFVKSRAIFCVKLLREIARWRFSSQAANPATDCFHPGVDPVHKAYTRLCARLASRGVDRLPAEGPRDFALRAARALPQHADEIEAICAAYENLRYGDAEPALAGQFSRAVKAFRP